MHIVYNSLATFSGSCSWAAGSSPTATCVGGAAGQTTALATVTEAVGPVVATVFPQANGAAGAAAPWSAAVGAVAVAALCLL